jgi:uncharacterized protein (TIGR03067 family)
MKKTFLALAISFLGATGLPAEDANRKDLERLQGDWQAVSMTIDGMPLPDDDAQALFRTIKGKQYTVFHFSKQLGRGTFTIDASARPRRIDARPDGPAGKAGPMLGIYEIEDGRFRICFAAAGKDRPTNFAAKKGSGHTLSVWEREKK